MGEFVVPPQLEIPWIVRLPRTFHPASNSDAARSKKHLSGFLVARWLNVLRFPVVTSAHQTHALCPRFLCPHACALRLAAIACALLMVAGVLPVPAQPCALPGTLQLTTEEQERILARAGEILNQAALSDAERQVRLQVLKAALTGTVIRPSTDDPEMRNPKHWLLVNDTFVVAPASTPVEAIADLWVAHENDGVPIPRIRCLKYTSLVLIQGYIQYFRETHNPAGLDALNQLIGERNIPQGLPNGGEDLLWKRRPGRDHLLPGDQVWFENPFFTRGRELIRQEIYQKTKIEGGSPEEAAATADASTESLTAGEEGSNVFCLGDATFIRGASSLSRLCRDAFQHREHENVPTHELVFTRKTFTLARFQQHMLEDNFTAQACLRATPASVRPEDFKIERVRSPLGPENLLRQYAGPAPGQALESLLDAMASHNKPPRLVTAGDATLPLFDEDYDWPEQQRVRTAFDTLLRTQCDDSWWLLRKHLHDDRYVLTATRGGVAKNFTVGELCCDLVDSRLCLGFTAHLPLVPGRLPPTFQPEQEYWQHETQWAEEHKPLYAMQAALCQRAIQQWEQVAATLPGSDGQAHIYTTEEKARYVASLKQEIAARNRTKQAACEEVIVPCLPAPGGWDGFDAESARATREEYERQAVRAH